MKLLLLLLVFIIGFAFFTLERNIFSEPKTAPLSSDIILKPSFVKAPVKIPNVVSLLGGDSNALGLGFYIDETTIVFFDGLSQKEIIVDDKPLNLILRDFDTKVAYGEVESKIPVDWAETPPFLGGDVYWISSGKVAKGIVKAVEGDSTYVSPVVLTGKIDSRSIGSPVFDRNGRVYGMVVGSDPSHEEVMMIRRERILRYLGK